MDKDRVFTALLKISVLETETIHTQIKSLKRH